MAGPVGPRVVRVATARRRAHRQGATALPPVRRPVAMVRRPGVGQPPPGAYGAPPGYGPPGAYGAPPHMAPYGPGGVAPAIEGSFGLGYLAGLFGGCIGFILVYLIAKGPATKKGAGWGWLTQVILSVIINVAANA